MTEKQSRYIGGMRDITDDITKKAEGFDQPMQLDTGVYWWVWGRMVKNGKLTRVLRGPYNSEEECYDAGYSLLGGEFECVPLNTRDERTASRLMRNRVANETQDVEQTFRKFKHKFRDGEKPAEGGFIP